MIPIANKYKEGQVVYATVAPEVKLVVRRYVSNIYYCRILEEPSHKELVYYERELMPEQSAD